MLVLTRKINETVVIGGNIRVTMATIRNRQVRLAIEAPPEVRIVREELVREPSDEAADRPRPPAPAYRSGVRPPARPRRTRTHG